MGAEKIEKEKKMKEKEEQQKQKEDKMNVDDDENKIHGASSASDNSDDDEDDDLISSNGKKKKKVDKPPISLELQRLFYQLQTGAESNHQTEYDLKIEDGKQKESSVDNGNDSDCSVFSLQSDTDWIDSS